MGIVLGAYEFDAARTSVVEKHEEIGGRDARAIRIRGVIEAADAAGLDAALAAMLNAASESGEATVLSLRAARRLLVARKTFTQEPLHGEHAASFTLDLEAEDPYEYAETATNSAWSITVSGATHAVMPGGDAVSLPTITFTAAGTLVRPTISDGVRTLVYDGTVADGEILLFDSTRQRATLAGVDVTPYVSGDFPRLDPAGTTLVYTDDAASSHTAAAAVSWLDRWW